MSKKFLFAAFSVIIGALAGVGVLSPQRTNAEENPPMLSNPVVLVAKSGAVTATGTVDCSAAVLAAWPDYVGAPDAVLTNVKWVANQRKGRTIITATFEDSQASPCWAKAGWPFLDAGRCQENADGTMHPCIWDSKVYGSDGWIFGNGVFRTGSTHLQATMEGGYYFISEDSDLNLFEIDGWDINATRG